MDDLITATREQLVAAFKTWDEQARVEDWPDATDPEASADYLIGLLRTGDK